jgi:hypothetical protein
MRSRMTLAMSAVAVGIVAFCSITTEPSRAQINLPQITLPGITPGLSEQPSPAQAQPAEQAKADNCLARPGSVTPRGRHWFYRMDRQTRRKCWYLGSASAKMRRAPVERTEEEDEASAPTPASPPAELRPDELRADELRPEEQPMSERTADAAADANPVAAPEFSASWPSLPNGVNANDADVTTATATTTTTAAPATATAATPAADDAGDAAALDAQQEEMPLVWPVLTAAERAAAAQTSDAADPGLGQLLTFLAAAAAFVALAFRVIFKLSSRLIGGSERRTLVQPVAPVIRPRPPAPSAAKPAVAETSIEAMAEPTIARLREIAKRWETPTRVPRQPRMPAYELVPDYKVEMTTPRRRQAVA